MPRKSNILLFPSKEYKLFLLSRNHTLAVQTLNVDIQLARSSYLWCHCVYAWCAQLYRIGICLSICISVGMPSIEWKWSEWIPLAELSALVAHTVGRSATETAQHCMATHRANQASRWHSLDITQERCTEQKKKKKATCPWQLYSLACLDSYPMNWYSKAIYTLVPETSAFLLRGLNRRATFFLFFFSPKTQT